MQQCAVSGLVVNNICCHVASEDVHVCLTDYTYAALPQQIEQACGESANLQEATP